MSLQRNQAAGWFLHGLPEVAAGARVGPVKALSRAHHAFCFLPEKP